MTRLWPMTFLACLCLALLLPASATQMDDAQRQRSSPLPDQAAPWADSLSRSCDFNLVPIPSADLARMERFLLVSEKPEGNFLYRKEVLKKLRVWALSLLGRSVWGALAAMFGYSISHWGQTLSPPLRRLVTGCSMVILGYAYALLLPAMAILVLCLCAAWAVKRLSGRPFRRSMGWGSDAGLRL